MLTCSSQNFEVLKTGIDSGLQFLKLLMVLLPSLAQSMLCIALTMQLAQSRILATECNLGSIGNSAISPKAECKGTASDFPGTPKFAECCPQKTSSCDFTLNSALSTMLSCGHHKSKQQNCNCNNVLKLKKVKYLLEEHP